MSPSTKLSAIKVHFITYIFLLCELQCTTDLFNDCPEHFNAIIGLYHAQSFHQFELQILGNFSSFLSLSSVARSFFSVFLGDNTGGFVVESLS